MSTDDASLPDRPVDSRSIHIRAARAQIVAARVRQKRQGNSERVPISSDAGFPGKGPPGYTLLRELQRGGQGVVYVAIQESTGRDVAIKQLYVGQASATSTMRLARFEREIEILSKLKHPNIVTIHDCGRHENHVYLVMDYIKGRPVGACADLDRTPLTESLSLFALICDGVNAAHLHGVIHRDLKPGNILVDEQGTPHVLDFGLAKLADDSVDVEPSQTMTATGQFVGSLPWASPEQAEGRAELLDVRTDVYSLGVILYQLLTGRFPYPVAGKLDVVVRHIVGTEPVRPSLIRRNLDRELDTILLKCLSKEPERRYQNAGDLARDIRRYLAGQAIDARGDSAWYIICKQLRRHRAALLAGCAFLAILIISSVTAWWLYAAAVQARSEDQAHLWESLVAQARAGRNGDHVGRRMDSLNAICRARDIRFDRELRDEAVACLALPDLRCVCDIGGAHIASARGLRTIDRFASVAAEGRIEVRAIPNGAVLSSLELGNDKIESMRFSPDGGLLAVQVGQAGQHIFQLWDTVARRQVMRLDCPARIVFGVYNFSPDGQRLGLIDPDGNVTLFDLASHQAVRKVAAGFKVAALDFDPAAARIALVEYVDPLVAIWDLAKSRVIRTLRIPATPITTAWSPDGQTLAVGADDHSVYLYEMKSELPPRVLKGHRGPVVLQAFNATGARLASAGWDGQVRVWDVPTGAGLMAPLVGCQFAGLSDRLALIDGDHLRVWEFVDVNVVRELRAVENNNPRDVCFVGSPRLIASSGTDGILLLDADRPGTPILLEPRQARSPIASPDGRHVYAVVADEIVDWTITLEPDGVKVGSHVVMHTVERPRDIAISDDNRRFIVCSGSELVLHDAATGQILRRTEIGRGIERPALSPDGRHAFVGNWKGPLGPASLVDLDAMRVRRRFPGISVKGAFSGDGRRLAVCTSTDVEVWDIAGDTMCWSAPRERGQDLAARPAFSPDSQILAIAKSMYEIELLDAVTGRLLLRLPNAALHMFGDLEFSRDGRSLLVGTSSSVVQVWDIDALRRELSDLRLAW